MNNTDLNYYEDIINFGNNRRKLSRKTKLKRKFLYIEGLIRFLELYCTNELGSGSVDIQKVCLWVNSPWFENHVTRSFRNLNDVYRLLEKDVLNNVPLYRLLSISDHLRSILEEAHKETLQHELIVAAEKHPCLKCIWYKSEATPFGCASTCNRPHKSHRHILRSGFLNINYIHSCKYCTTVGDVQVTDDNVEDHAKEYRDHWMNKYNNLDNSVIPVIFENLDMNALKNRITEDPLIDLARIFGNKQSLSDIYKNLQRCMIVEAMIRFIEVYAKSELGSNFLADISKITEYVYTMSDSMLKFSDKGEIYSWLEDRILMGDDVTKYCKIEF